LPDGDAEQISINLQAAPSFEAFGRYLEASILSCSGRRPCAWSGSPGSRSRVAVMPPSLAPPLSSAGSDVVSRTGCH